MRLGGNLFRGFLAVLLVFLTVWGIADFPVARLWLAMGGGLYAMALWRFPFLWLFAIPALLPVLDLAPWSGRFFFGAFDFVVWGTWAVLLSKPAEPESPRGEISAPILWLVGLLAFSFFISALVGLLPLPPLDANAFSNYYSRYNSLRIFKGFFYAWAFFPFLRREVVRPKRIENLFLPGVLVGLCGVGLVALWERQVFSGLFNFTNDFRITSTFSEMHTGGAYVDAFLAMSLPLAASCFLFKRGLLWHIWGSVVFLLGLYTCLVTFSRIIYLSLTVSSVLLLLGLAWRYSRNIRFLLGALVLGLLAAGLVFSALRGTYIQERFARTAGDAMVRLAHWKDAIQMMDGGWGVKMFGMGMGSYPRTYFEKSGEGIKPGGYAYREEDGNTYLRLTSGGAIYVGQKISLSPHGDYTLSVDLRSQNERAGLNIPVCEKSLLHSFQCKWLGQSVGNTNGQWVHLEQVFSSGEMGKGNPFYQRRPIELALYNGKQNTSVDIDNVQLINMDGSDLLKNGDFSHNGDYWFFTTDNYIPWNIDNLFVHVFFENGAIGTLLLLVFLGLVIRRLVKGVIRRHSLSVLLLASMGGLLTVGLIGSLFDSPRITLLFFLIAFIALMIPSDGVEIENGGTGLVDA